MHCLFLTALAWCFHSDTWQRSCCDQIKFWINSVHFDFDTSSSFFPLLLYSACLYSSQLFSISGALSSSLLCWFFPFLFPPRFMQLFFKPHWPDISIVIVEKGAVVRDLNLTCFCWLWFWCLMLFLPVSFYSACLYSSLLFSTSGALSSSLFCWLFPFLFPTMYMLFFLTALAMRFLSNSWYRSCCDKIKYWINSVHFGSDTSCSFFPLLYSAGFCSSQLFSISGALSSSLFVDFFAFSFLLCWCNSSF